MEYKIRNRKATFDVSFPETFKAKGWGSENSYNTLEVEVGYAMGGMNYFSGESSPRGFYIYFSPCNLEGKTLPSGDKYWTRQTMLGTGAKVLIERADRYNAKKLEVFAQKTAPVADELARAYVSGEREAFTAKMNSIFPGSV